MKLFILACTLTMALAVYTDVDDKIDIVALDNNDAEIKRFFACYLDKGPCTPTMMSYKKHMTEALHTKCAQCTPLQKHIAEEFLKTSMQKFPELVQELKQKYAPTGDDFKNTLDEFAKYDYK